MYMYWRDELEANIAWVDVTVLTTWMYMYVHVHVQCMYMCLCRIEIAYMCKSSPKPNAGTTLEASI